MEGVERSARRRKLGGLLSELPSRGQLWEYLRSRPEPSDAPAPNLQHRCASCFGTSCTLSKTEKAALSKTEKAARTHRALLTLWLYLGAKTTRTVRIGAMFARKVALGAILGWYRGRGSTIHLGGGVQRFINWRFFENS